MNKDTKQSKVQSYLNQIRKHLWRSPVHGRAAVMVGCGFSRNARPVSRNCPKFPLWYDLAKAFLEDLCLNSDEVDKHDPLQLASRLEIRIGRAALDRRLKELVPDREYEPGDIHTRLLNLPWADVFTTNYDTLLERTCSHLEPKRRYTVLRNQKSVAGSSSPRIVKLHGSFPDHEPLIITDDDYRRYPVDHAPFVNTVQQSMLENALVLVGFSGDDPNFLKWSGWVRDNLMVNAPRIYLCGPFGDLDESQVALFEKRNIAVVDLEALSENDSTNMTHEEAIEKLLTNLEEGEPKDFTQWPYDAELTLPDEVPSVTEDLPTLRQGQAEYPGWIVCPWEIRDRLWGRFLLPRVQKLKMDTSWNDVELEKRLAYLRELVWRLELCLYPLANTLFPEVVDAVDAFFKAHIEHNANECEGKRELAKDTPQESREAVSELLMALLRDAREEMDSEKYNRYLDLLAELNLRSAELLLRLHYEKCLWAWYQLDFEGLEVLLKDWPVESATPFWETKRASLLLDVGQYDEAWRILDDTLLELRSRLQEEPEDIWLLSQESWTMRLLDLKFAGSDENEKARRKARRGRWRELEPYMCDPFREFDAVRQSTKVTIGPRTSVKSGFDPGTKTVSHSIGSTGELEKYPSDHTLQRFHEETAFQIRLGPYVNSTAHLRDVLQVLLLEKNPTRAYSLVVRCRSQELVELLGRSHIARIPEDMVSPLFEWFSKTCARAVHRLSLEGHPFHSPPPWDGIVSTTIELLSRLSVRMDEETLSKALDMACQLYGNSVMRAEHELHKPLRNLFKRTLFTMSVEKTAEQLPFLLALPLGDADGAQISLPDSWPEPFDLIRDLKRLEDAHRITEIQSRLDRVPFLIDQLRHGSVGPHGTQQRALSRLMVLREMDVLSQEQKEEFGRALWEEVTEAGEELPRIADHYPDRSVVLWLPERKSGEGAAKLRSWLLNTDLAALGGHFEPQGVRRYPPDFMPEVRIPVQTWNHATYPKWRKHRKGDEAAQLEWSAEQASTSISSAIGLWNNQKGELTHWQKNPVPFFPGGNLELFFLNLSTLISKTLIPYLGKESVELHSAIEETLLDMLDSQIAAQRNLHMLLWFDPGKVSLVSKHVEAGMHSKDRSVSGNSFAGVREWALMAEHLKTSGIEVPEKVRRSLLAMMLTRNTPAYDTLIEVNASIVKELPDFYSRADKDLLCEALEAMLDQSSISAEGQEPEPEGVATDNFDSFVLASQLAAALFEDYEKSGVEAPELLQRWRELTINTRLPELRRAWVSNGVP